MTPLQCYTRGTANIQLHEHQPVHGVRCCLAGSLVHCIELVECKAQAHGNAMALNFRFYSHHRESACFQSCCQRCHVFCTQVVDAKMAATNAKLKSSGQQGMQVDSDSRAAAAKATASEMRELRASLLKWIIDVLRAPMSENMRQYFLSKTAELGGPAPPQYSDEYINMAVVAHCIALKCPATSHTAALRDVLLKGPDVPPSVLPFIQRQGNDYGVYVVGSGTYERMLQLGLQVKLKDLSPEAGTSEGAATAAASGRGGAGVVGAGLHSVSINQLYLDTVREFTDLCCFVYVRGLPRIEDTLLKWLAEYTKVCVRTSGGSKEPAMHFIGLCHASTDRIELMCGYCLLANWLPL